MLEKKKRGMKTAERSSRTTLSAAKERSVKIRTRISGSSERSSWTKKAISSSVPATIEPIVCQLPQPQSLACWRPRTESAMPPVTSTAPR